MIFYRQVMKKNVTISICSVIVIVVLFSGCVTDPATGKSTFDTTRGGALLGAVGGAAVGHYVVGGKKATAIGAAIGAGVGGLAGYTVSNYLNADEQRQYDTNLNNQMKRTSTNSGGSGTWKNVDQSKSINDIFSQEMPLQQAISQLGSGTALDTQIIATLPSNTVCRVTNTNFQINHQQTSSPGAFCRNTNDDYVRINT